MGGSSSVPDGALLVDGGVKHSMVLLADGSHVHVIDPDFRRRARISRDLIDREFHTEIYEDPSEFLQNLPDSGTVLISEQPAPDGLAQFFDVVRERGLYYPVSVYADSPSPEQIVRAMRHGALDYLQWPFDPDELAQSLRRVLSEGAQRVKIERERAEAKALINRLTDRERDVLLSLLKGNSNKEVAEDLAISPRTVEIYRKNMMDKLQARSASQAARIAIYAGLWEAR